MMINRDIWWNLRHSFAELPNPAQMHASQWERIKGPLRSFVLLWLGFMATVLPGPSKAYLATFVILAMVNLAVVAGQWFIRPLVNWRSGWCIDSGQLVLVDGLQRRTVPVSSVISVAPFEHLGLWWVRLTVVGALGEIITGAIPIADVDLIAEAIRSTSA